MEPYREAGGRRDQCWGQEDCYLMYRGIDSQSSEQHRQNRESAQWWESAAKTSCLLTGIAAMLVLALLCGTLWREGGWQEEVPAGRGPENGERVSVLLPDRPWLKRDQAVARSLRRPMHRHPHTAAAEKRFATSTTEWPMPAALEPFAADVDRPEPEKKEIPSRWGFSTEGFHVQIDSATSAHDETDVWDARSEQSSKHSTTMQATNSESKGKLNASQNSTRLESHSQCGAADRKIWKGLGQKFPATAMKHCASSCYGQSGCVTDCIRRKEGFSKSCSGCFGAIASCTASNCMFQCLAGGTASCRACVDDHCDDAMWACLGFDH